MDAVLSEGARRVKPDGLLITDHDPQLSAWDCKGLAARHGFHKTGSQQWWGLKTEVRHCLGDGVTREFFLRSLEPLGFEVEVHAHNHQVGSDALEGIVGPAHWTYRLGNLLSGGTRTQPPPLCL